MTRWLRALAALLFLAVAAGAAAQAVRQPDGLLAVPPLARVTDQTGTLSGTDRQSLDSKLAAFETAHGSQIAIVMVASTQPEPISDYAQRLGDAWKIGRAGVGDGLLIVVAKDDRKVWIAVAKALEGAIPDLAAKRVIRESIAPRFKDGDFAGGLSAGLDSIFKLVEGEGLPAPIGVSERKIDAGEGALGLLVPFIMVGLVVGAILRRIFGKPGALLAGGGAGAAAGWMLSSLALGAVAGVAVLVLSLIGGAPGAGRVLGGRRGGLFIPGGWGGGGGGGWSSGGGGGWSSGGGGDFGGGGAGGSW
jgi:uncharacterized protein